jgi:hypothetical protein
VYEISYKATVSIVIGRIVDAALTFRLRAPGKIPTTLRGDLWRIAPLRPDNEKTAMPLAFLNSAHAKTWRASH